MHRTNPAGQNVPALFFRIWKLYLFEVLCPCSQSQFSRLNFQEFVGCQLLFLPLVSCQLDRLSYWSLLRIKGRVGREITQ